MNGFNVNNVQGSGQPVDRNRGIPGRMKPENTEQAEETREAASAAPEKETVEPVTNQPGRDVFQSTADREFVIELTAEIENTEEPPPREEAVERARARVSEGYYNTREFTGNLATRLINTEPAE